jgi:hypothetical protein
MLAHMVSNGMFTASLVADVVVLGGASTVNHQKPRQHLINDSEERGERKMRLHHGCFTVLEAEEG